MIEYIIKNARIIANILINIGNTFTYLNSPVSIVNINKEPTGIFIKGLLKNFIMFFILQI